MFGKKKETVLKYPLFMELAFTLFAFLMMIVLSFIFTNKIVHTNLVRHSDSVLDYVESKINADLMESRTMLDDFAQSVQSLVRNGTDAAKLTDYNTDISSHLLAKNKDSFSPNGPFCYIEKLPGGPAFINGIGWKKPDSWNPTERPWYLAALAASGDIAETEPFKDTVTGETVFSYARCLYDHDGNRIGVVAIDVRAGHIGKRVANTALTKGGNGVLISQDLTIIGHQNPEFIGLKMYDPRVPLSILADELTCTGKITGAKWINWKGEPVVGFFKTLPNGWRLGLLSPENMYYQAVYEMALVLCITGISLAAVLIVVLIRLDTAKNKSDRESKCKSAFLANMSHEIRTPMNAITGMSTIGKSANDIEDKDYCFEKINDASNHLLGVINDILDMSKIEANKFELAPTEFDFEKSLKRIVNVNNLRIDEKFLNFSLHIDGSIPRKLILDEQRLAQVITNLLGNAIKFTPEQGCISLDVHLVEKTNDHCTLQFSVNDTGIGISSEQKVKLFRAFEQAETSTARKYGGTGLGLAISKNIVEMMGGGIWVESQLGKGSSFIFTVKAAYNPESNMKSNAKAADERHDEHPCGDSGELSGADNQVENNQNAEKPQGSDITGIYAGKRILLAEDVEINREILQTLLDPTQLEIDCADNGLEAVNMFSDSMNKYDMIFMDIQMPEMDGYEATRHIRSMKVTRAKTIPIIAMTANVFREDVERCLDAGMDNHIGKPINFDEVLNCLNTYLYFGDKQKRLEKHSNPML